MKASTSRKIYQNPPIVEAIAQFRFPLPLKWDVTTPGVLFERVKSQYPEEPEIRNNIQTGKAPNQSDGKSNTSSFSITAGPQQIMFFSKDRNKFVMISENSISAHSLPPYEGWEALEARLIGVYQLVNDLFHDNGLISQCSVRYINRIELPTEILDFKEYLTIDFDLPDALPQEVGNFFERKELAYPSKDETLTFTWASVEAEEGHAAFILDLDLSSKLQLEKAMSLEEARQKINMLKVLETEAFEGLILERLREVFGEIKK